MAVHWSRIEVRLQGVEPLGHLSADDRLRRRRQHRRRRLCSSSVHAERYTTTDALPTESDRIINTSHAHAVIDTA